MNPYRFDGPDDRHRVINFSGGRSSGFMLAQIIDAYHGSLPDHVSVIFANTGKEREETLDFIRAYEEHFGFKVVWAEYRYRPEARGGVKDPRHVHVVVDHATASRGGEPFHHLIRARKALPNIAMRFCTTDLKVRTVERYMRRDVGIARADFLNVLGIRHDEPKRWSKALFEECKVEYPMVDAGATLADVMQFWRDMPFDLQLSPGEGNCDLCFLKGRANLVRLIRDDPSSADWWSSLEGEVGARFRDQYRYADLVEIARNQPELPFPDYEEQPISCFCGD